MDVDRYMVQLQPYNNKGEYSISDSWFTAGLYLQAYRHNETNEPYIRVPKILHLLAIL